MRHFQRLNVAFSRGRGRDRYAPYVLYSRNLIHGNPFVRPPLLVALMDFAKTNRLVHTMPEPLVECFPDLPTWSHDIQKENESHEECRSARKVSTDSLATERPASPWHSLLASVEPERPSSMGFELTDSDSKSLKDESTSLIAMVNVTIHAHSVEEYGHDTPDKLSEGAYGPSDVCFLCQNAR